MSVSSKLTNIANEVRIISGTTEPIGLDAMATHINEANDKISLESELIEQIAASLIGKSVDNDNGNNGITLPSLVNPGNSSTVLNGYEFINESAEVVTGTIPIVSGKTITPSTSIQYAIEAGNYTEGDIIVDAIPQNYKNTSNATITSSDILSGKVGYGKDGQVIGNIPTKTSSDLTISAATVTAPAGYYASDVSKSVSTTTRAVTTISTTTDDTKDQIVITASNNQGTGYVTGSNETATTTISLTTSGSNVTASDGTKSITKSVATATQATPSITVNSSGLITASATQTAGYVSAGTKSGTKQLTTQAAKTVTPSISEQTAVASGVYTTGTVKVAAIPSNYKQIYENSGTMRIVNGRATVNCGFQPDAFEIIINDNYRGVDHCAGAIFSRSSRKKELEFWDAWDDDNGEDPYPMGWCYAERTTTGVIVSNFTWANYSWDEYLANNSQIDYYAVKYT